MNKMMYLFLVLVFFASCQSVEEQRLESIKEYLVSKGYSVETLKILPDGSSLNSFKDSILVSLANKHIDNVDKAQINLNDFIESIGEDSKRIWLKTMTVKQQSAYAASIKNERIVSDSWTIVKRNLSRVTASENSVTQTVVIAEFNRSESTKEKMVGIFYFHNTKKQSAITGMQIMSSERYSELVDLYKSISKYNQPPQISLEALGYDIVPIDEDPTKTKEERVEIKRIQQEKKLAEEQRKREVEEARKNRQIDNQIIRDLRKFITYWNQGCPTMVDEITMGVSASFSKPNIYYNYRLLVHKSEYTTYQWEAFGSSMKSNLKSECQNILQYFVTSQGLSKYEIKRAFDRIGLNWTYVYRDVNGNRLFTVTITPDDLN